MLPIFRGSCSLAMACHARRSPSADLTLGDVCNRDEATGECAPLPEDLINTVHANLLADSMTVAGVKRVAPGDLDGSFLLDKTANRHTTRGYACSPQDVRAEGCGDTMPPGGPSQALCTRNGGQATFDVLAAWVLQGAPND